MPSSPDTNPQWGSSYRLTASEKWKAKSAAMGRHVTDALVELARPRAGLKILDLASGTGEPAITLATRIGSTGHVTALDLSEELLAIAAGRARDRGLANVSTQKADAHSLPFPDNTFDLATSRFGVMFFSDIDRAFSELRRVLKPGARCCFVVWGPQDQPYFSTGFGTVHRHIGGPLLTAGGPDPFRFGAPGTLSGALARNGFNDIHEESRILAWTWPGSVEEVWEQQQAVATPFLPLLKRVPPDRWTAINAEIHAAMRHYETPEGIRFGASVVLSSAHKP